MTSRRPLLLALALTLVGCAEAHPMPDAAMPHDTRSDAPRTCSISATAPLLVLQPADDNPADCRTAVECELWFGHGQHLRCPRFLGSPGPFEVACSLGFGEGLCLCDDTLGFVADFSTEQAVRTRDGVTCRYRIVREAP